MKRSTIEGVAPLTCRFLKGLSVNTKTEKRIAGIMQKAYDDIDNTTYKIPRLKRKRPKDSRGRERRPVIGIYESQGVEFSSILECALELKTDTCTIRRYIEQLKPICGYLLQYKDVMEKEQKAILQNLQKGGL